jgi:hypothetical protein
MRNAKSSDADTGVSRNTKSSGKWKNIKDMMLRVNLDDFIYYSISFLSLIIAPLAGVALFQSYYVLVVNREPVAESFFSGLNCSDTNSYDKEVCNSTETFNILFTLFQKKDDFFYFKPHTGQSFCNSDSISTDPGNQSSSFLNTTELPTDVQKLFGGNIGDCSETSLLSNEIFACITLVFALFGAIWLTVISGHYSNIIKVHLALAISTMICSSITIIIFALAINPSRSSVDPTFCESQSLFENCNGAKGSGFYCQIAVAVLSLLTVLICGLALKFDTSGKTLCCGKDDDDDDDHNGKALDVDEEVNQREQEDQQPREIQQDERETISSPPHPVLHARRHLLMKFGRFLEFFLAILAFSLQFTKLELLYSDGNESIEIDTYLWNFEKHGWAFCSDNHILMNLINLVNPGEAYGNCIPRELLDVYEGFLKVIIFGGFSLFLKRDAKRNPMFYLGGIISDIITIIFVSLAIYSFYTKIYPGRSEIEPSLCDQFNSVSVINGVSYNGTDDCNISLGSGFWVLCVVLLMAVLNFVTEFVDNEIGQEYGAINAFKTVFNRLRKGRMKSAILDPASIYHISQEIVQQVAAAVAEDGGEIGDDSDSVNEIVESDKKKTDNIEPALGIDAR